MQGLAQKKIVSTATVLLIFLVTVFFSLGKINKWKAAYNREMAKRLDAEEKLYLSSNQKTAQEEKLKQALDELKAERLAHEATRNALAQQEAINQSLKAELEKMIKLKEKLEETIRNSAEAQAASSIKVKK